MNRPAILILTAALASPVLAQDVSGPARVIDGDTLHIAGERIRLHGVDAPERDQTCAGAPAPWPCGAAATSRLRALTKGRQVACKGRERDSYGRLVASCAAGGADLAGTLAAEGLAWAYLRFSTDYVPAEDAARKLGLGVWQADTPPAWAHRTAARAVPPIPPQVASDCPIKGNVNRQGARIYHVPASRDYAATRIDETRGERWFCTEAEARAAGWRSPG